MMKIKKNKFIVPAIALAVFMPLVTMAASDESISSIKGKFKRGDGNMQMMEMENRLSVNFENLSDKEREKIRVEMEVKRSEIENRRAEMKNLTSEEREVLRQERLVEMEKMETAMNDGDYDTWLELAKNNNCPFINEVTRENFSEFAKNHQEKLGARGANKELGFRFKDGNGKGMGERRGERIGNQILVE